MASKIEALLRKATNVVQTEEESREDFLTRLVKEVFKLPEDQWDRIGSMSGGTEAQDWVNSNIERLNKKQDVLELPDYEDDGEQEEEEEEEADGGADDESASSEDGEESSETDTPAEDTGAIDTEESVPVTAADLDRTPARPGKKRSSPKTPAMAASGKRGKDKPKAEAKTNGKTHKAAKAGAAPKVSVTIRAKELLIQHGITQTAEQVFGLLKAEGFNPSMQTLKVLCADFRQSVGVLSRAGKTKGI